MLLTSMRLMPHLARFEPFRVHSFIHRLNTSVSARSISMQVAKLDLVRVRAMDLLFKYLKFGYEWQIN